MPNPLYTFDDLQTLERFQPKIVDGVFTFDESILNLEFIDLSNKKELDKILFKSPQPNLRYLDASRCSIRSIIIPAGCEKLEMIYLHSNQITEITIEGDCPKLELLDLSENKLTQLKMPFEYKSLGNLFLRNNNLTNLTNLSRFFTHDD